MTAHSWLSTGWSTGKGVTAGNLDASSQRVTCTDVARRVTDSGEVTKAIRATAFAAGRWYTAVETPLIYFGSKYMITSPIYDPQVLQGKTWAQIAALHDPSSAIAPGGSTR